MIVNWSASRKSTAGQPSRPHVRRWLSKAFNRPQQPHPEEPFDDVVNYRDFIRGQMHVSLQHDGRCPASEVTISGSEGSLRCTGWLAPFFGHVVELNLNGKPGHKRVERCFGSGESTYFYQLERFCNDINAASTTKSGNPW